jgi:hypothetical protein
MKKINYLVLYLVVIMATPVFGQWSITAVEDEMSGIVYGVAYSSLVAPNTTMGFPYGDVKARMSVMVSESGHSLVYFEFTESPNINNTRADGGYNRFRTRIKWDDDLEVVSMRQKRGGSLLEFEKKQSALYKIAHANNVLLEVSWYGEGFVYFEFSLSGSSKALSAIGVELPDNAITKFGVGQTMKQIKAVLGEPLESLEIDGGTVDVYPDSPMSTRVHKIGYIKRVYYEDGVCIKYDTQY